MAKRPPKLRTDLSVARTGKTGGSTKGSNDGPNISNKRGASLKNAGGGSRYRRDRKGRFA